MASSDQPTKEEMEARVKLLALRILEGSPGHIAWIEESFSVKQSAAYDYMNKARKLIASTTDMNLEVGRGLERLHNCQQAMMQAKDYQGAVRAQSAINKMLGLNKPDEVMFKGQIENVQVYLPDNGRDEPEAEEGGEEEEKTNG